MTRNHDRVRHPVPAFRSLLVYYDPQDLGLPGPARGKEEINREGIRQRRAVVSHSEHGNHTEKQEGGDESQPEGTYAVDVEAHGESQFEAEEEEPEGVGDADEVAGDAPLE